MALATMVSDSQPTTDPYNKVVTVILRRPDSLFLLPLNGTVLGTVLFELLYESVLVSRPATIIVVLGTWTTPGS
jgi:hypothetical protein